MCWLIPNLETFLRMDNDFVTTEGRVSIFMENQFFCFTNRLQTISQIQTIEKLTFYRKLNSRRIFFVVHKLHITFPTVLFRCEKQFYFLFFFRYSLTKIIAECIRVFDKHFSLLYAFYSTDCVHRLLSHSML